jgi:UDP-2,3-diacylglucosamine hydrolase
MPHSLFISDLHLSEEQPQITRLFLHFLRHNAQQAEALYILGDLFEYWAGDDDLDAPLHRQVSDALHALSDKGTRIFLMHGNRDLLMGEALAAACGATMLPDPTLIDLYGTPAIVSHGDALCTDDAEYQAFRSQVRNSEWQRHFLAQPLAQRKAFIEKVRAQSEQNKQTKAYDIMDVNPSAVESMLRQHAAPLLIHGHTHRMAEHRLTVDGRSCTRWVLGDWHAGHGNALKCAPHGCALVAFS